MFPLRPLGYTPEALFYLQAVGVIELSLGLVLIAGSSQMKRCACVGLMVIMIGGAQTLICIGDKFGAVVPVLFFISLCSMYPGYGRKHKVN